MAGRSFWADTVERHGPALFFGPIPSSVMAGRYFGAVIPANAGIHFDPAAQQRGFPLSRE
jgi:hypothetical protein